MNHPKLFAPPPPCYRSRREFLARAGGGFGTLALAGLLGQEGRLGAAEPAVNPLAPRPAHFPGKAKAVIWLFMNGGPSHVDTWDYKPQLAKLDGQELKGFDKNTGFFTDAVGPVMKSPFARAAWGRTAPGSPRSSRTWPNTSIGWPSSIRVDRFEQSLAGAVQGEHRHGPQLGFPCLGSW